MAEGSWVRVSGCFCGEEALRGKDDEHASEVMIEEGLDAVG